MLDKIKYNIDYFFPEFLKDIFLWAIYKFRYRHVEIKSRTKISKRVTFGQGVTVGKSVDINGNCYIGDYTFINDYSILDMNVERVGKFCSISHNVKIGLRSHPLKLFSTSPYLYYKYKGLVSKNYHSDNGIDKTIIEDDVYIAANAVILSGVNVGTGSVIAAGAVVSRDVPPYAIVAGIPARVISYRFDSKTINNLLGENIYTQDIDSILKFCEKINMEALNND